MTSKDWVRAGLVYLASYQVLVGLWQFVLPRSFYDDVPTVDNDTPFNEHLMRDVGGLGLALAVVIVFAAVFLEYHLVCAALAGNVVYAATHFGFHVLNLGGWSTGDAVLLASVLGIHVLIPLAVLLAARRQPLEPTAQRV
ncbi:hypothetical protein [Aeromicrobium sp. Leaf350]|uniref:hypothetical protein n=1 Tax=Aeromicrobium sp. Leaf350 TaxID=2876565 RepID=UPI001E2F06A1|nr:hypothetical protein [Aeromicrobium sp. Leaf350]